MFAHTDTSTVTDLNYSSENLFIDFWINNEIQECSLIVNKQNNIKKKKSKSRGKTKQTSYKKWYNKLIKNYDIIRANKKNPKKIHKNNLLNKN